MPEYDFRDKTALVTGASTGIGRALCVRLAELGADVIAVARTKVLLDELKRECEAKGRKIIPVVLDIADWNHTRKTLNMLAQQADFLVNNAGLGYGKFIEDIDKDEVNSVLNVNLKAPINLTCLVAEEMKRRKSGVIVNVSSVSALAALDQHLVYGASKAGLDMVTKVAAKELAPFNIRVNSVNPTVVWTKMGIDFWGETKRKEEMISKIPMGRFVKIHEVVEPIIFLLSDKASGITGITLPVDGGFTAC